MLNPSTADAKDDDNTIRKCIQFANREHFTHLTVVNLFALRATNPDELLKHKDPVGPDNIRLFMLEYEAHKKIGTVLAAWGAHKMAANSPLINEVNDVFCLGTNKNGSPKHPLYISGKKEFETYGGWKNSSDI